MTRSCFGYGSRGGLSKECNLSLATKDEREVAMQGPGKPLPKQKEVEYKDRDGGAHVMSWSQEGATMQARALKDFI